MYILYAHTYVWQLESVMGEGCLIECLLACLATAAPAFEAPALTSARVGTSRFERESPAPSHHINSVTRQ